MNYKVKLMSYAIALALGGNANFAWCASIPAVALSDATADSDLQVAGKKSGKFLAVWSQDDGKRVFGRYTEQGVAAGEPFQIVEAPSSATLNLGRRSIAMNADGNAVLCWQQDDVDTDQILCRQIPNNSNSAINTPTVVVSEQQTDKADLSVSMDDLGDFILLWPRREGDSKYSAVMARRFSANGTAKENEFVVAETTKSYGSVSMDKDGDTVAAWESGADIFARRIAKDSSSEDMSAPIRIDRTPENFSKGNKSTEYDAFNPVVAMDDTGNFVVAWQRQKTVTTTIKRNVCETYEGYRECYLEEFDRYANSAGLFVQRFDVNDLPQNVAKKTGDVQDLQIFSKNKLETDSFDYDVAMDANGNFVVAWNQNVHGKECSAYGGYGMTCYTVLKGHNIFARRFDNVKHKLAGPTKVATKSKSAPYNYRPSVAMQDDGSHEVAWSSGANYNSDNNSELTPMVRYLPAKK